MAIIPEPTQEPAFFVHECTDCSRNPPECTTDIRSTCPFNHIRNPDEEDSC